MSEEQENISLNDEVDTSAMTEMILYIAKTLSHDPSGVSISEDLDGDHVTFNLVVSDSDKGRIIGKEGRTIQAIRSLLKVAAVKYGISTKLEVV